MTDLHARPVALSIISRTLLALLAALTLLALWAAAGAPAAQAHVPDCRAAAIRAALADERPATPALVASYRQKCAGIAAKHAQLHRVVIATNRCVNVPRSGMSRSTCRALATAAVERRVDAWAWSTDLHRLLGKESTWNPNAVNDASEACGLFQRLVKRSQSPGRGCPWRVSGVGTRSERVHFPAVDQARDGLRYIAERPGYGSPARAWAFWLAHGWY